MSESLSVYNKTTSQIKTFNVVKNVRDSIELEKANIKPTASHLIKYQNFKVTQNSTSLYYSNQQKALTKMRNLMPLNVGRQYGSGVRTDHSFYHDNHTGEQSSGVWTDNNSPKVQLNFENTIKLYGTQTRIDTDNPFKSSAVDFDKHYQGRGSRNQYLARNNISLEERKSGSPNEQKKMIRLHNSMIPGSVKNNSRLHGGSSLINSPMKHKKISNDPSPRFNLMNNSRLMTFQNYGKASNLETERMHRTNESFHIEPHQLPTITHLPTKSFNLQTQASRLQQESQFSNLDGISKSITPSKNFIQMNKMVIQPCKQNRNLVQRFAANLSPSVQSKVVPVYESNDYSENRNAIRMLFDQNVNHQVNENLTKDVFQQKRRNKPLSNSVQVDKEEQEIFHLRKQNEERIKKYKQLIVQRRQTDMLKQADKFLRKKTLEREQIETRMVREEQKRLKFSYLDLVKDFQELVDDNVVQILNSNDEYERILQEVSDKRKRDQITEEAKQITDNLEGRAQEQRQKAFQDINKIKQAQHLRMFFGNKRDQLVLKFIGILKKKVQDKKENLLQKSNEQFIRKLMRQESYNSQFKQAVVDTRQSVAIKKPLDQPQFLELPQQAKQKRMSQQQQARLSRASFKGMNVLAVPVDKKKYDRASLMASTLERMSEDSNECEETVEGESSDSQDEVKKGNVNTTLVNEYIAQSLNTMHQPLPILQKITPDLSFPLINYHLNHSNVESLAHIFPKIIPKKIRKLYLVNNGLQDKHLKRIVKSLFKTDGLKSLVIIRNGIGQSVLDKFIQAIVNDKMLQVKQLVLKDPHPAHMKTMVASMLCEVLNQKAIELRSLNKLALCKLGLDNQSLKCIGEAFPYFKQLEHLDISANVFDASGLYTFFSSIHQKNQLRSLNISYSSCRSTGEPGEPVHADSFEHAFAVYLHKSTYLMHLDMSGMNMTYQSIEYIVEKGIRKSRTLLAVHMSGLNLTSSQAIALRGSLKVRESFAATALIDYNLLLRHREAKVHALEVENILKKSRFNTFRALHNWNSKQDDGKKVHVKEEIRKPLFKHEESQRVVYQRVLGRNEILGAHNWVEQKESMCHLCCKYTYCIILWNKSLARSQTHDFFFNHSDKEPVMFNSDEYKHPLLCTRERVFKMLPFTEFFERILQQRYLQTSERACNNQLERENFLELEKHIQHDVTFNDNIDVSYWDYQKQLRGIEVNSLESFGRPQTLVEDVVNKIIQYEQRQIFQPNSLQKYAQFIDTQCKAKDKIKDTYACAMYLPDNMFDDVNLFGFLIKHPHLKGVDLLNNLKVPRLKHLSCNSMPIRQKRVRKVKEVRVFSKPRSVFDKWHEDTPNIIQKCYKTDIALAKLHKFIKDPDEQKKTQAIIRQHYEDIKKQFLMQIAQSKSYPSIEWLDFVDACQSWGIIDKYLTQADVDRIFIATNYEEESHSENDDNTLCRYEFAEILVRFAITKYFDKGLTATRQDAVEELLRNYILPNSRDIMPWQEFRDQQLWTLEVDDLIRANQKSIDALYKKYATVGMGQHRTLSKDDALALLKAAKAQFPESFNSSIGQEDNKRVVAAYCLSKMTPQDEMAEFSKYNAMLLVEFYEFIGRWAELHFKDQVPLTKKYEMMLQILLPVIGQHFNPTSQDDNIPSDSDYDDDMVDSIVQKVKK